LAYEKLNPKWVRLGIMPIADKRAMAGCVACERSGVLRLESVRAAQGRRRDE
jgi:hypothetical protein